MPPIRRLFALVAGFLALLALPSAAAASVITVDSTADVVADDGFCTLREAITAANTNTASGDSVGGCPAGEAAPIADGIEFGDPFNSPGDKITITAPLPDVSSTMDIQGPGGCGTPAGSQPCVEVGYGAPTASPVLVVSAQDVALERLAITNGSAGVTVSSPAGFSMQGCWIGLGLSGGAAGNQVGILLEGGAQAADIGASTAASRNVISGNTEQGVRIVGGDDNRIRGNYIGVNPAGTAALANAENVEVVADTAPADPAVGNEVGATVAAGPAATAECDGGCNVISGATTNGLDLEGDVGTADDAGATDIHGNFIGLSAAGAALIPNATHAVLVNNADGVTVGGAAAADANHIAGGSFGVSINAGAFGAVVQNNVIGMNSAGTVHLSSFPVAYGIDATSSVTGPAAILDNRIAVEANATAAIVANGGGAAIAGNTIGLGTGGQTLPAGSAGVLLRSSAHNATVQGNTIANVSTAGGTTPGAGIQLDGVDDALLGGVLASEENDLLDNAGAAIAITDATGIPTGNTIARTTGSGNGGLFVDIGNDGVGNDDPDMLQGGIDAPVVIAANGSFARGSAEPGATVRVFSKAVAGPGEIAGYLGQDVADAGGGWRLEHSPQLADGDLLVATQTDIARNTSELSDPPATTDAIIPAAPTIDSGPGGPTNDPTPTFAFSGEAGASFACAIDAAAPSPCDSGSYTPAGALAEGDHTFKVTATDAAENTSPQATRSFRVDTAEPDTTITRAPKPKISTRKKRVRVSFTFEATDTSAIALLGCSLDDSRFSRCTSPFKAKLKKGKHVFAVRATDGAGNVESSPATARVKVKRKR